MKGKARSNASPAQTTQSAFSVKLVSPISSAGTYRVFVERSDLIFIQIEGGSLPIVAAAAPLLGPLGGLIPIALSLFAKGKARAKRQGVEEGNPEDLLRESGKNFKLHQAEIRDATIEAQTGIAVSGKAGRLNFLVRHGEKIRCEFANTSEMKKAILLLVQLLNSTLKVNVEWNEEKERFDAKKKDLTR